jgi:hypothetical protein
MKGVDGDKASGDELFDGACVPRGRSSGSPPPFRTAPLLHPRLNLS